jgi:hypothetical protein
VGLSTEVVAQQRRPYQVVKHPPIQWPPVTAARRS